MFWLRNKEASSFISRIKVKDILWKHHYSKHAFQNVILNTITHLQAIQTQYQYLIQKSLRKLQMDLLLIKVPPSFWSKWFSSSYSLILWRFTKGFIQEESNIEFASRTWQVNCTINIEPDVVWILSALLVLLYGVQLSISLLGFCSVVYTQLISVEFVSLWGLFNWVFFWYVEQHYTHTLIHTIYGENPKKYNNRTDFHYGKS